LTYSSFNQNQRIRWIFYAVWITLGLAQAFFTEISSDEAYYWRYAQNLQWGYFDHPPMIALLIKIGSFIFNGVLGVRILIILLNTVTIFLLEKLSRPQNISFYYMAIASLAVFHLGGMLAIPDAPLLFFAVVYLLVFEQFLKEDSWKNSLLLGISASLMLYSKYHGVLVIGFSVLAQPRILLQSTIYTAGLVAAILMIPHVYWQHLNDWPSLNYHLSDRSVAPYEISFTLEYLLYTFLLQGPIIAALLFFNLFRPTKQEESFSRSLQFISIGIIAFFLISSFKGRVEPHWTLVCAIPLVALYFRSNAANALQPKTIRTIFIVSLALIIPARVLLMIPLSISGSDYHKWQKWVQQIEHTAMGAPVAIMNSYQKAAKYEFYSGQTGHSLNNIWYRRNQYDLWNSEEKLWGKRVLLVLNKKIENCDSLQTAQGVYYYVWVEDFAAYSKIKILINPDKIIAKSGDSINLNLQFEHTYILEPDFSQSAIHPTYLSGHLFKGNELIDTSYPEFGINNALFNQREYPVSFSFNAPPGKYHLILSVQCGWMPPTINSKRYPLTITD
jgi:hypothetical protein